MSTNPKKRSWLGFNRKDDCDTPYVEGLVDPGEIYRVLQRERSRSGRTGLPVSMVVFWEVKGSNGDSDKPGTLVQQLGELLVERIRCTDVVGWVDSAKIALLLPDTDAQGACKVVADVREQFAAECGSQKRADRMLYRVHTSEAGTADGHDLEDLSELRLLQAVAKNAKKTFTNRG